MKLLKMENHSFLKMWPLVGFLCSKDSSTDVLTQAALTELSGLQSPK